MELQEAISNSIKKFKHDMVIDDKALYDAIEKLPTLQIMECVNLGESFMFQKTN